MTIRVLILDDEPLFGQSLVQSLALCDDPPVDAVALTTAAEALEAAMEAARAGQPFDAFLIDQRLGPGPDGIDVLQELLSYSPRSDAIVFTIAGDREAGLRAYQAGAYRYLHKPFRAEELVLVLQTMQRMRDTRIERDWLRVIAEIAETAQRLLSLEEVQRAIVTSSPRLGFERARLWLYDAETGEAIGADQEGDNGSAAMRGIRFPATNSPYLLPMLEHDRPIVFHGQSEGPSYLFQLFGNAGYSPPLGDWVGLPLRTSAGLIGLLMLDNYRQERSVRPDQVQALEVFGRQVAVALERAQLHEREQRRSREIAVLAEIGRLVSGSAAILPLDDLLEQIRRRVGELMSVDNCFIALYDDEESRLELRLEVDRGERRPAKSLSPRTGLVGWVVRTGEPLLLTDSSEIAAFARRNRIKRRGDPARCWLGVPLVLEHRVIGAIVVQSYDTPRAYDEEDRRLLAAVADQVVGVVHNARLKEEGDRDSRILSTLLDAGRELMHLALEDEARFWHLTLTMATAGYALGFNRAALLLLTPNGTALHGTLGIGHRDGRSARASWKRDLRLRHSLAAYRKLTAAGLPPPTPIEPLVRQLQIPLAEAGVFADSLRERRRFTPPRRQIQHLPADFLAALGKQNYAVLPIYAGQKRFGILVVDNAHTELALSQRRLDQLETWLAQVALAYENRRQHVASERLVSHAPELMAHAADRPLQNTLSDICQMALALTAADNAMIYPLDAEEGGFDTARIGLAGGLLQPFDRHEPPDMSLAELRRSSPGDLRVLPNIDTDSLDSGQTFIRREQIRASIAAPLHRPISGEPVGLLYLNYRNPQRFSSHEQALARNLARLSAAMIGTAHTIGSVRDRVRLGENELSLLSRVLRQSLEREVDQNTLARSLLDAARDLLVVPDWQVGLILRDWKQPANPVDAAVEVRRKIFYRAHAAAPEESFDYDMFTGITGYVLQIGDDRRIDDVKEEPWKILFRPRFPGSPNDNSLPTRSELDVLIRLDGKILGLFNVESPHVAAFNEEHHARLRRLADVAALALDNVQRREHQRTVLAASSDVVAATSLDETLKAVLQATRRAAPDVSAVAIWRIDRQRGQIVEGASFGLQHHPQWRTERLDADKVLNRVLAAGSPIWAEDATSNPVVRGSFVVREGIASVAAFPLAAGGEQVGVLFFNYRTPHRFSRYEQDLFGTFAAIVAAALRDTLHLDMLGREHERLEATIRVAEAVGPTIDLGGTLYNILGTLRDLFRERGTTLQLGVLLYDESRRTLAFHPASREFYGKSSEPLPLLDIYTDRSIASRVARMAIEHDEAYCENVPDVSNDPDYLCIDERLRCELCLALMSTERDRSGRHQLLGTLVLESDQTNAFDDDDVALIKGIAKTIGLAIDRARTAGRLRLESAIAAATVWVHDSAHDIHSQVGRIRRHVGLLQAEPSLSAKAIEHVEKIDAAAAELGRAAIDPHSIDPEPLWIDPWLKETIPGLLPDGIRWSHQPADPPAQVLAVKPLLERAVRHLVRNAVEAMTPRARPNEDATSTAPRDLLTVKTERQGASVRITFSNDGQPIPEQYRERLFNERVTTKGGRPGGIGGLGLLFVRWAVEAMGGAVGLVSAEAPVTFEIRLPIAQAEAPATIEVNGITQEVGA